MTPVEVDILFNETVQQLKVSPSERIRLNLIDQFIDAIAGFEKNYQSYLIQLVEELPSLPNPLLFAGIHPSNLQGFIRRLDTACTSISELKKNEFLEARIDEYKSVLGQILQWLGASTLEEEVQTKLVESKAAKISIIPGEVIVPVVEEFNGITAGRLRRLKVEIIGLAKEAHELKPNFGIVGAEIGNFAKTVESAVLALANESEGTRHQCWKASVQFELPHAWHTGSSANLAMAGAFFGEQMKAEEQQELFWLNPAACITGDLDKQGNVLPVNPQTIPQKVEAAFFSWCQLLIVPSEQLAEVHEQIAELNIEFPNRRLPVVGVSHLRELFYDRRVTLYKKETALVHNAKKAWRRRKSVGAISLIATLILVISSLVYGPVDRNPVIVTFEGENRIIRNNQGRSLSEKAIGNKFVDAINNPTRRPSEDIVKFFDLDDDGTNEIIEFEKNDHNAGPNYFMVYNLEADTVWKKEIKFDFSFDNHGYINETNYLVRRYDIVDIDSDGRFEIAAIATIRNYFSSLFFLLDLQTGDLKSSYVNAGYLSDFQIVDFDNDGFLEVLISGEVKGYRKNGLILLDSRYLDGNGILGERYKRSDGEKAIEKAVILFPQSIVGKKLSSVTDWSIYGAASEVRILPDSRFDFLLLDYYSPNEGKSAGLVVEIDYRFNIESITSTDSYDIFGRQLFDEGKLSFIPSTEFVQSYRDSLLYWNGKNFQSSPVLNTQYLQNVGIDSVYYLDHFFNN